MSWFDALTEGSVRAIARRTSRRSLLASLGSMLMGASVLPLLPIARGAAAAENPGPNGKSTNTNDPNACEYWRHCGIDGFLCGCCGGSTSSCPPRTEMSAVTWVRTRPQPDHRPTYL